MVQFTHEILEATNKLLANLYLHKEANLNYVPKHWHRGIEIIWYRSTPVTLWINGESRICLPDEPVIVNSGEVHEITPHSYENPYGISIIYLHNFLHTLGVESDELNFKLNSTTAPLLKERLQAILDIAETRENDVYYQLRINGEFFNILHLLLSHCREESDGFQRQATLKQLERCKRILMYIDETYQNQITLDMVADQCQLSSEHTSRFFKKYFGCTFKEHLSSIRVLHALEEVTNSNKTMLQIALDSGFPDYRSFSDSFRKLCDKTPLQYRKYYKTNVSPPPAFRYPFFADLSVDGEMV